jgi:hypothetical protein
MATVVPEHIRQLSEVQAIMQFFLLPTAAGDPSAKIALAEMKVVTGADRTGLADLARERLVELGV